MNLEVAFVIVIVLLIVWCSWICYRNMQKSSVTPEYVADGVSLADMQDKQLAKLNAYNQNDIVNENIDPGVISSHAKYADEITKRTSTASKHADFDHPAFSNWIARPPERVPVNAGARQQYSWYNDEYSKGKRWLL
jgi:hypothetical protein